MTTNKKGPFYSIQLEHVLCATMGEAICSDVLGFTGVSIDSRKIEQGMLFVAILGEKQDGHSFIENAIQAGARGILVCKTTSVDWQAQLLPSIKLSIIAVDDTQIALGQLALFHRKQIQLKSGLQLIAVTGSHGKTTVKEMIAQILTEKFGEESVLKTEGNLNNHLGVPLMLLRLQEQHRFAVIEMGMSSRGEIAYVAALCEPCIGVITQVGRAHLEAMISVENVAEAKGELFYAVIPGGKIFYLQGEQNRLVLEQAQKVTERYERQEVPVSIGNELDERISSHSILHATLQGESIEGLHVDLIYREHLIPNFIDKERMTQKVNLIVPLFGGHHLGNIALAAAVALHFGVTLNQIQIALQRLKKEKHRGQILHIEGRTLIDDCYNASPDSTRAAILGLCSVAKEHRKVVILGDMLEVGDRKIDFHQKIGEFVVSQGVSVFIAYGEAMNHALRNVIPHSIDGVHCSTIGDVVKAFWEKTYPGDFVLVKASRGISLERAIEELEKGKK